MLNTKIESIDGYIIGFPDEIRERLLQIRELIKKHAPNATESMTYGIPSYKVGGRPLVYFGGYKKHIGFYATPSGHEMFKKQLSEYKQGKGSVQFPHEKPLPLMLIEEIVKYRLSEIYQ